MIIKGLGEERKNEKRNFKANFILKKLLRTSIETVLRAPMLGREVKFFLRRNNLIHYNIERVINQNLLYISQIP